MQLTINNLATHLKSKKIFPIYLISGDVPLLLQETIDTFRHELKQSGFSLREQHSVESNFNWQTFFAHFDNMSLFGDNTLVELFYPTAKFEATTLALLEAYLNKPSPHKIVLIVTDKLTAAQQKSKWFKIIDNAGACISIFPVKQNEMPRWVSQRAAQLNIKLQDAAIHLLIEMTQGNLLAAQQSLEKAKLLFSNEIIISADDIKQVLADSARFNVFELADFVLSGQTQRYLRCLRVMKETGVEPVLILWSLAREFRALYEASYAKTCQGSAEALIRKQWTHKQTLFREALNRWSYEMLTNKMRQLERIDHMIKGLEMGNVWDELDRLI